MKKIKDYTKKILTGFLATTVMIAGIAIMPVVDADAADKVAVPDSVFYEEIADVKYDDNDVPVLDGYLFGGYYDNNKKAMTTSEGATYAKFVPAYILSIKAQNYVDTEWTNEEQGIKGAVDTNKTITRLVTGVDCADYSRVGFEIIKQDGTNKGAKDVSKVYEVLNSNGEDVEAEDLFRGAAYCAVLELKNIPETSWDQNTYVRPYWVTPDNTTVYGLPKYVRVDDGLDGYLSIAVNLKTAEDIAAGVVKVKYDDEKLDFDDFYAGKVFEEMEVADKGGYVKCVGNVETISENAKANDMYIGLRFKNNSHTVGGGTFLQFEMSEVDFANNEEKLVDTLTVWDVQY